MLIVIAISIAATSTIGTLSDLNEIAMIRKTAKMETMLTI